MHTYAMMDGVSVVQYIYCKLFFLRFESYLNLYHTILYNETYFPCTYENTQYKIMLALSGLLLDGWGMPS